MASTGIAGMQESETTTKSIALEPLTVAFEVKVNAAEPMLISVIIIG